MKIFGEKDENCCKSCKDELYVWDASGISIRSSVNLILSVKVSVYSQLALANFNLQMQSSYAKWVKVMNATDKQNDTHDSLSDCAFLLHNRYLQLINIPMTKAFMSS